MVNPNGIDAILRKFTNDEKRIIFDTIINQCNDVDNLLTKYSYKVLRSYLFYMFKNEIKDWK